MSISQSTHPAVWCIHARKRCLGERSASLNVYISVYSPCRMVHSRQEALSGREVCYIYLSLLTLPYGAFTTGSAVWVGGLLDSMFISQSTHPAVWCIHARKRCLGERSASLNVYISVYSPCRMVHSRQEALFGWEVCYIYLSLLTLPYGAFTPGSAVWVRGMLHISQSTHPAVWCIHARKRCLGERYATYT